MNKKVVCNCNGEPSSWRQTVPGTFFLMPSFNNRFAPIYTNPSTDIRTGVVSNINNNRENAATCNNDTKQQRLSIRHKPTPWRMPYNHSRKSFSCGTSPEWLDGCTNNEKIIKDTPDTNNPLTNKCCKPIYTSGRLVGKLGIRLQNNGGNYSNYLQSSGKLYTQNAFGILPENKLPDASGVNLYKINTVNGTVENINSNTVENPDCKIAYKRPETITTQSVQYQKIATATRKWANPGHSSRTSVSSRNRMQRLKYNTILGGQSTKKYYDSPSNCINGQECSKYMNPGATIFMRRNIIKKCIPPRLMGMRQACPR